MKLLICTFLFLLAGMTVYSQNPLSDGVNRATAFEEEDDATYLNLEKFTISTGNCRLEYGYDGTFIDGYEATTYEFSHLITVPYKNITSIEVFSDAINITAGDINTKVTGEDPFLADSQEEEGLMTVYFSSYEDSQAAASWLQKQVSACGGTAVIVDL